MTISRTAAIGSAIIASVGFAAMGAAVGAYIANSMQPPPVRPPKGLLQCGLGYQCTLRIIPTKVGEDWAFTCDLNLGQCWDDPPKPEGRK